MASTIVSALSAVITQVLDRGVTDYLPMVDPAWKRIKPTSDGVSQSKTGRDFKVIKTYSHSVAGVNQFATLAGEADLESAGNVSVRTSAESWPSPFGSIRPVPFQDEITLVRFKGNLSIDTDLLRVNSLNATILDYIQNMLRGHTVGVGMAWTAGFYTNNDTTKGFFKVGTIDGGGTATLITFTVTDGRIFRVANGTRVTVFQGTTSTPRVGETTNVVVIDKIDPLARKVSLRRLTGTQDLSALVATGDTVGLYESYGLAVAGLETYLKTSGTVRNITLADHPEFKSMSDTSGGALNRTKFLNQLGKFNDAYGLWGIYVDTFLTTQGVVNTFMANDLESLLIESRGRKVEGPKGFDDSYEFFYDGRRYELVVSRMCAHNTAYGVKFGESNWKRYLLPRLPKAQAASGSHKGHEMPQELYWVNPVLGQGSIWANVYDSSGNWTNMAQAPYEAVGQTAPDQVQGILFTNLTETIAS